MAWLQYAYVYLTSKEEEGQGMVEYGLMIALVALVAAAGFLLLGEHLDTFIGGLSSEIAGPST